MSAMPRYVPSSETLTDAPWQRSSFSTGMNNCVETAPFGSGTLAVRDSKNPAGPALLFPRPAWAAFLAAVREGAFDCR
ncbi:DUF397 domain-containing protein [Streptomyces sp. URMC 123]|uniref:DUF397 domain-containing protein n=1 Tax=Streptomyces sp. URMC 123 TaxID=3423403 RepID=UPI003F1DA219